MKPKCVLCGEIMDYDQEKKEYVCWVCDKILSTAYRPSVEEHLIAVESRGAADERARIVRILQIELDECKYGSFVCYGEISEFLDHVIEDINEA